ncbi:hypothetical protein VKT23_020592 [Stygiomarasmius scandens]|uniref:Uncharacterized protein n=1 Tax=Marasmiellus scandens TaxID=2682957 RepID=A0ABR1IIS0_9AGAR
MFSRVRNNPERRRRSLYPRRCHKSSFRGTNKICYLWNCSGQKESVRNKCDYHHQGADSSFGIITVNTPPFLTTLSSTPVPPTSGSLAQSVPPAEALSSSTSQPTPNPDVNPNPLHPLLPTSNLPSPSPTAPAQPLVHSSVTLSPWPASASPIKYSPFATKDGLLNDPVSGLMGLARQTIASSGATPLWQQETVFGTNL